MLFLNLAKFPIPLDAFRAKFILTSEVINALQVMELSLKRNGIT